MSTLAKQVAALRAGDTVTLTLSAGTADRVRTATLTGEVWAVGKSVRVGPMMLSYSEGGLSLCLVSVDSVTPKPLDEPTYHGAMAADRQGNIWARSSDGLWCCIDDEWDRRYWAELVRDAGPLTPFVPTPDEEAGR